MYKMLRIRKKILVMILMLVSCNYQVKGFNAYWFNLPEVHNFSIKGKDFSTSSKLYVYDTITNIANYNLFVQVTDSFNNVLFDSFFENFEKVFSLENNHYRIEIDVPCLNFLPTKLIIKRGHLIDTVECRYKELSIMLTSNISHSNGVIGIYPDGFSNDVLSLQATLNQRITIFLPERVYHAVFAVLDDWGEVTLESWYWQLNLNKKKEIIFNVGNGEIYNLHCWVNNGGFKSSFIFFRPMTVIDYHPDTVYLYEQIYSCYGNQLSLSKDSIKILINNIPVKIHSLQSVYETGMFDGENIALKSYLLQIPFQIKPNSNIYITFSTKYHNRFIMGEAFIDY